MVIFTKQAGGWSFGEETTYATAATTKNKWPGLQRGDFVAPMHENEIAAYRSAGSLDALVQKAKKASLAGSLDLVLQHAWPIFWYLGKVTNTDNMDGTFTHKIEGDNTRRSATLHQILSDGGTTYAIDWLGAMVETCTLGCEEDGELYGAFGHRCADFADGVTAQTITALTRDPYLWSGATWNFYNPGTTAALTGLTAPDALRKWEYGGRANPKEVRGHRNTKAHLPITIVKGRREHELTLTLNPDQTLYQKLVRDRVEFDFVWRSTRGTNDYLELQFKGCFAKGGKFNQPDDDGDIAVEVQIQPRKLDAETRDTFATLIAAT